VFLSYNLNLIIHLFTAILVWWLTLLTFSTPAIKKESISRHANVLALFAGLIFVSHPLQTEAVTYIVQRAACMAALFYLLSLCLYVKSRLLQNAVIPAKAGIQNKNDTIYFYYISSLLTAILAMFTKENAISLPLMILLYEFSFLKTTRDINWRHLIPFFLTLLVIPLTALLTELWTARLQHIHVDAGILLYTLSPDTI
jgi:hypothetical protein